MVASLDCRDIFRRYGRFARWPVPVLSFSIWCMDKNLLLATSSVLCDCVVLCCLRQKGGGCCFQASYLCMCVFLCVCASFRIKPIIYLVCFFCETVRLCTFVFLCICVLYVRSLRFHVHSFVFTLCVCHMCLSVWMHNACVCDYVRFLTPGNPNLDSNFYMCVWQFSILIDYLFVGFSVP